MTALQIYVIQVHEYLSWGNRNYETQILFPYSHCSERIKALKCWDFIYYFWAIINGMLFCLASTLLFLRCIWIILRTFFLIWIFRLFQEEFRATCIDRKTKNSDASCCVILKNRFNANNIYDMHLYQWSKYF